MVIFKGNKRLFDKVIPEDNGSTGAARKITIYGVTAYTDIENVPIQINSSAIGAAQATINVNNLGAITVKTLDNDGIMMNVEANWTVPNQIYTVVYKSGVFILVTQNQTGSGNDNFYIIETLNNLVSLTSSSTQTDILHAFNNDISAFLNSIIEGTLLIAQDNYNEIYINYILNFNNNVLEGFILEFIYKGYYYKQTFTTDSNMNIVSVTVIKSSVENPSVTVEDDLTSDSHVNPPSVYAVNQAIGQIDTLLDQILGN